MSALHHVAHWALPPSTRPEHLVRILSSGQEVLEYCYVLTALISLILVDFSDILLQDDGGTPAIWNVAITERVEITLPRSLSTVRHCTIYGTGMDLRMGDHVECVLFSLPFGAIREVHDISILLIISSNRLDPITSLIVYCWSSDVLTGLS